MSKELWYKINNFNFDDQAGGEYTFTVRLAKENYWTINFTKRAMEEYKKFMYLTAITDQIVSPSEIVDVVWHQHLVYTKLYNDFSQLVGKQIQHIPSTHNKKDFNRFKQARERTKLLYDKIFGKQPADIWATREMYDSLNLEKSKLKIRTFLVWGLVFNLAMLLPSYYFLKPMLIQMSNFYFFTLLISITVFTIILLINLNSIMIGKILSRADKNSFIFNLHPSELIYSRRKKPEDIINSYLDFCIRKNAVLVTASNKLQACEHAPEDGSDLFGIMNKLKSTGPLSYSEFFKVMTKGSAIFNVSNSMDAFVKYVGKSKKFGTVFYINYFFTLCFFYLALQD